jgi:hypothetical protein
MLWLERNACVFNRRSQSASELAAQVLEQVELLISARFYSLLSLGSVAAGRQHRDMASVLYFFVSPFWPRHQSTDGGVVCNTHLPLNETRAKARSRKNR